MNKQAIPVNLLLKIIKKAWNAQFLCFTYNAEAKDYIYMPVNSEVYSKFDKENKLIYLFAKTLSIDEQEYEDEKSDIQKVTVAADYEISCSIYNLNQNDDSHIKSFTKKIDMEISEDGDFIVTNKILTSLEKNKDKYLFNQINLLDNKEISTAMELVELNLRNILAHYLYIETEDAKIGDTILFKDIMLPTQMYYDKNLPLWENKATFSDIYKDENKGFFKNKYIYEYDMEKNLYQLSKKVGNIAEPKDDDEKQVDELYEQVMSQDCTVAISEDYITRSMNIGPIWMDVITNVDQKKAFKALSDYFDKIRKKGNVTDEDLELEI